MTKKKASMSLDQYLAEKGLTASELATLAGINAGYLSQLRKGAKLPSLEIAMKISEVTGGRVPVTHFVDVHRARLAEKEASNGKETD